MIRTALAGLAILAAPLALAATGTGTGPAGTQPTGIEPSPYVDLTGREIKALSAEEIGELHAGEGMGLALPAELNGYPGPRHVLDMGDELGLSAEQRTAVQRQFDSMHRDAVALGGELIEAESRLDRLFADRQAAPDSLRAAVDEVGRLRAALRYTHLDAHVATRALLSEEQIQRYDELRGYADGAGMEHHHDPASHHGHHGHGSVGQPGG